MNNEDNLAMFKAYDIRTTEGLLSDEQAKRLIDAVAFYIINTVKAPSVVLGRDARLGVTRLMQLAIDAFPLYGLDVIVNPLQVSTCQFYFSCMQNLGSCGIMFTASHNPGDYIGLKILAPSMVPLAMGNGPEGGITRIKDLYIHSQKPVLSPSRGRVIIHRYLDQFIDYSMKFAGVEEGSLKGSRILLDFLCGAAGTEVTEALSLGGAEVCTRNLVPDGRFPIGDPNPIVLSSIQPTWDLMAKGGFDFGLAFDGDGDRMDFIASNGSQLAPSFNFSIMLPSIRHLYGKAFDSIKVYSDVKVNPMALALQSRTANVRIIRNGHSFIKEALRQGASQGCVAACEESAHYYMNFPIDPDDPGKGYAATENTLFFSLLTASLACRNPEAYDEALRQQSRTFRAREWPVRFWDPVKMDEALSRVKALYESQGLCVIETTEEGGDLDATLMRHGLPRIIDSKTSLDGPWYQVAQRISRSEDRIARWEITGSNERQIEQVRIDITRIIDEYVELGQAQYL